MKANLAVWISALLATSLAGADLVGEETWYSAEGEVVKKVKRTEVEVEARHFQSPGWEPAWVIRERERGLRRYPAGRSAFRYFHGTFRSSTSDPGAIRYFLPGYRIGSRGVFPGGISGRYRGYCRPVLGFIMTR